MVFEVETGTGSATATALATEAFVDAWALDHPDFPGASSWGANASGDKQASIIDGTLTLGSWFGLRWSGRRKYKDQGTDFPRVSAIDLRTGRSVDSETVPVSVQQATAILSIKHRGQATVAPLLGVSDETVQTAKERVKIGPLEFDDEFVGGGKSSVDEYEFTLVCSIVEGLLLAGGEWVRG